MGNIQEWLGIFIILAPIIIFVFTMLTIKNRLADQKVKLADLLAEIDIDIKNRAEDQASSSAQGDKATLLNTPYKRSTSRLILFLSGITSLILGVCITTFYFYMSIYCLDSPEGFKLSDFTYVLLALGIGVVPYAINQVKKLRL